jgi:hypothetical protein
VLDDLFILVDDCVTALAAVDSTFGRVAGLYLAKARNLALGCYSLSLDSLAQEGGALFRPLFEAYELLTYFRLEPSRIDEVLENRLPSAGNIAKRIDGEYHHASHLSLGPESMRHLVDPQSGEPGLMIVTRQPFRLRIALVNLQTLFAVFALVGTEGVNCALFGGSPLQSELADRMVELKCRGLAAFDEAIGHLQA